MSQLTLRWNDGDGRPGERALDDGVYVVGRASASDIPLSWGGQVSRAHARISVSGDRVVIEDLQSRNGTMVNDERISSATLRAGDVISVGGVSLSVEGLAGTGPLQLDTATIALDPAALDAHAEPPSAPPAPPSTVVVPRPAAVTAASLVPDELLQSPVISEAQLLQLGVPVEVVECAALGGGVGSFVLVDLLRCSGMAESSIAVIGTESNPFARYDRLCQNSQIPPYERLRSNSDSTPDNVWGFPGYALREGARELRSGHLKLAGSIFWSIFGEPAMSQTYTPRLGDVVKSVAHEAERIGWSRMLRAGRIRAIRKTQEGRLAAIVSTGDATGRRHTVVAAKAMHIAIGYPAIQMLPDLAEYREKYGDFRRVVNAYENHDHIYAALKERGGVVLIRGRGIVASRIIQRIAEEHRVNRDAKCVHLHRSRLVDGHRWARARRQVEEQFEFQPFNWPKACWGGDLRERLERANADERKALLDAWGGTSTAARTDWRAIVKDGIRDGWYRQEYGTVKSVALREDGRISTEIESTLAGGGELELTADWVIDCTGLVAAPRRSPLLADLLNTYQVPLNSVGRVAITNDFEITQLRHGPARAYMAGAMTLGGPMAAVDSFLGLQFAALRAADAMRDMGLAGFQPLNGLRSAAAWWKWARKAPP